MTLPSRAFSAASMNAINDVRASKELTKKKVISSRPTDLPDAESLYDELQIVRKEIATQQKVIKTQQTRNGRLAAELKHRESQLADIFDGAERKSKNDQLQARILHLEFELREKNDELAKVKFDKQTNSLNELKQANEIYATELARLKKIIFDRQEVNRAKVQEERKQQIGQLKSALAKIGKERETLKLENGKFTAQLDTLKNGQMDEKMKSKKELDTLRTELRRARVSQSKQTIATSSTNNDDNDDALRRENEHLKKKIEKMASEAKVYDQATHGSGHAIDKLENTVSDLQLSLKEAETREQTHQATLADLRRKLDQSEEQIATLEEKISTQKKTASPQISRRSSVKVTTPPPSTTPGVTETDIIGALTTHIFRTDLIA